MARLPNPVDRDGFALVPGVLDDGACDALLDALAAVPRSRAGARHLLGRPAVASLANDRRLLALAAAPLGGSARPFRATLFDKSRTSNWLVAWHQDTALPLRRRFEEPGWGPWSKKQGVLYAHAPDSALARVVALRVHLDDSDASNGALRVLPGSHARGVLSGREVAAAARSTTPADCVVGRGGILVMRPLLIHSSPKAVSPAPRRVLHVEYADSLVLAPRIELAEA